MDERHSQETCGTQIANDVKGVGHSGRREARGYFPGDMPGTGLPEGFVDGRLVGAWDKVYGMIKEMKGKDALVFN